MISRRPYFLRAMHEWIVDCGHTPHIVIDVQAPGVEAPSGYASDGKLVVNVSPAATQGLSLGNDYVSLQARFSGTAREILAPVAAVLAVYSRETGEGIVFSDDDEPVDPTPPDDDTPPPRPSGGPNLKVVK